MASVSLTAAANSAAQFLGVLDSGEGLSSQQITDAFAIANNLLLSWYNEQVLAIQELVKKQGQEGATLAARQAEAAQPLITAYALGGGFYNSGSYNVPSYTPGTAPQFSDNTTPLSLPNGWVRAFILGLGLEIAPQYNTEPTPDLVKQATEARQAALPPMPGAGVPAGA